MSKDKEPLDLVNGHSKAFDALLDLVKGKKAENFKRTRISKERRHVIWDKLFLRQGEHCYWCDVKTNTTENDKHCRSMDHMIPQNYGGPNHVDNLVLACRTCDTTRCENLDLGKIFKYFGITKKDIEPYL